VRVLNAKCQAENWCRVLIKMDDIFATGNRIAQIKMDPSQHHFHCRHIVLFLWGGQGKTDHVRVKY